MFLLPAKKTTRIRGADLLAECRSMLGWPYDRGGCLRGRVEDGHASNSWKPSDEGWHIEWGGDGRDNDGDGEKDEADEHFVVCSDILVQALERHDVYLYPLMAADYRERDGQDYTREGPYRSQDFFPRRVKNLVSYFKHEGKLPVQGSKPCKRFSSYRQGDILFCHSHMGLVSSTAAGRPTGVIHASYRIARVADQPVFWEVGNWWYENVIAVGRW